MELDNGQHLMMGCYRETLAFLRTIGREADIVHAAVVKNGERPSAQQVRRYIARADANGDGWLDETEYLALLEMERREKREAT